jgi:hypothetical protein
MATNVVNPTNSPPRPNQPLPFIRNASGKATVKRESTKDKFNSGVDYVDEGAPLLTSDSHEGKSIAYKPYGMMTNPLILPPTKEEMEELAHPDERNQTQIRYLKEAVVMDVDAKLIVSTMAQMKNGVFREAHYPTMVDYMKSPHYRKLREAYIMTESLAGLAKKTKLREAGVGPATIAGVRLNPRLVRIYNSIDKGIYKRLKESGFQRELKRFKEDGFTLDAPSGYGAVGPNWDGGQSFGLAGREPDFIPLMAGPYNKQLYWFDYLDMHSKAFDAWTHNPIAKRIVKVISQFVLGKGVKLTVQRGIRRAEELSATNPNAQSVMGLAQRVKQKQTQGQQPQVSNQPQDYKMQCQAALDRHWMKNSLHIRSKQILRDLIIFGEQFPRYFDAPWGLKIRQIDPSTIWEIVTDPDDAENEFYVHQQYPTKYQWYVDLPVPTIKFIIRQVPAAHYFHMKINSTAGEVRGRSELFAILGWLKRMKEYASDRVIRNKMANLFVLDVAIEGDQAAVQQVQLQMQTPPTPGSFFFHNKAAELKGIAAEVGASETQGDWEMLLTVISMGAGISQQYLGMGSKSGGKAEALVGTEPDIKTFEDYQELMEEFFLQDAQRVFDRAKERGELPKDLVITVEATYPSLAEENRSEKLKDLAFMESMSWVSHRRVASAAAKEMQMTSYDYDHEQEQIAEEDAMKEFLINTAYQQVVKGTDSATVGGSAGSSGGGSSGSSGKGASGMGMGKIPGASSGSSGGSGSSSSMQSGESESFGESETNEDEDTAPGTSTYSHVSSHATTHNASRGDNKELPWRGTTVDESTSRKDPYLGRDPRDITSAIKREAANLRYQRRGIGRRQDRIESPYKVRDQKSLDRTEVITKAKRAARAGHLNKEAIQRFPRYAETEEVIHKTGSGYQVKSEKGKNLSSPNLSKRQAKKRLAQVEYFKHKESEPRRYL